MTAETAVPPDEELESDTFGSDFEEADAEGDSAETKPESKPATPTQEAEPETAPEEEVEPEHEPEPPEGAPEPPGTRNIADGNIAYTHRGDVTVDNSVNNYHQAITALERRAQYKVDREAVDRELEKVVPPPETKEYLRTLGSDHLLVLTGGPRTGLTTAARYCWSEFARSADLDMRVLDPDDSPHLKRKVENCAASAVLFLDASRDRVLSQEVPHLLRELRDALRENGGHLVIALGAQFHTAAVHDLPDSVFGVDRPEPRDVLASYIEPDVDITRLLADMRFCTALDGYWPPRIEKLAAILNESGAELDMEQFLQDFDRRLEDWEGDLREMIEKLEPDGRALLVSAAVVEGAPPWTVALAAAWFTEAAGFDAPGHGILTMPSLSQRLEPLKSVFRAEGASSNFTERFYGEALLPLLWNQFPTWRESMCSLFDRLLSPSTSLDDNQITRLLLQLLELAAETDDAALVLGRAVNMVSGGTRQERRKLAGKMLLAAATDTAIGRQTRYQLWSWAYNCNAIPYTLQLTIAETCGSEEYARRFPDNALRRLKHLSNSDYRRIRTLALESMMDIALSLPVQSILEHLAEWADHSGDRLHKEVPDFTARLLGDEAILRRFRVSPGLIADGSPRAQQFWRRLSATASPADVRKVVAAWLALAAKLPVFDGEALANALTTAADSDIRAMGQLLQAVSPSASAAYPAVEGIQTLRKQVHSKLSRMEVPQK